MDQETLWGLVFVAWVSVACVPYFYATALSMGGEEKSANQIIDRFGAPWLFGFVGLLGLWSSGAHAAIGLTYSVLAGLGGLVWLIWKNSRKPKAGKKSQEAQYSSRSGAEDSLNMMLSRSQRYILIAVAVLIGITLVVQIDKEGLPDSPWMIGLLVIAGLLLLAFAPRKSS